MSFRFSLFMQYQFKCFLINGPFVCEQCVYEWMHLEISIRFHPWPTSVPHHMVKCFLYFPSTLCKYGIIFMYYLNHLLYCKNIYHSTLYKVLYDQINENSNLLYWFSELMVRNRLIKLYGCDWWLRFVSVIWAFKHFIGADIGPLSPAMIKAVKYNIIFNCWPHQKY